MQLIENHNSISTNRILLKNLVGEIIDNLEKDKTKKNKQKKDEVFHVGKLLMILDNQYEIAQLSESPDFILQRYDEKIGLEHQIILDQQIKQKEGFYESIFSQVELLLQQDVNLPNLLCNCYIRHNASFKEDKKELVSEIYNLVKQFVEKIEDNRIISEVLEDNRIIDRITVTPHSQINITPNFGAWFYNKVNEETIQDAVSKKEELLDKYINNSVRTQWLLLVTEGIGESSYEIGLDMNIELTTKFDKVYLLVNFYNQLFELK